MSPIVMLVLFSIFVLGTTVWMARHDIIFGGFFAFFYVYTIFAMVGYQFYPLVSWSLRLYFGTAVYEVYFWFVTLSFAAFAAAFAVGRRWLVRTDRYGVAYAPRTRRRLLYFAGCAGFLVWMAAVFARDYNQIAYTNDPQMPDFLFAIGFKQMIVVLLVLYAVIRRHSMGGTERGIAGLLFLTGTLLFIAIASKVGSRSDILALLLGLAIYEAYPAFTSRTGGLRLRLDARQLRVFAAVSVTLVVAVVLLFRLEGARTGTLPAARLPLYATILYNDYFTPAHMLFAAIGLDFVQPMFVLKSNLANAFFVGRVFDVPYLQTEIGNIVAPGSSSRTGSFGFYIFAEGYLAFGRWGFLYNGIVPLLGIALWRLLLASSADRRFNAFGAALTAMFFASIARSGTVLIVRDLYFFVVPALVLFWLATGAFAHRPTVGHAAA
jgi:hypothetical protein